VPIYEFTCQSCGEPFEELVGSFAEADEVICPHCESPNVKRKISGFAAISGGRRTSNASTCVPGGG
jgi:putative FmdB family regulatory protein